MDQTETPPAVVNLADELPADTGELHIVKPGTNDRTGWVITMAGPGHPQTIALNEESARERLHREKLIEQAQVNGKKYKSEEESPQERTLKIVTGVCRRIVGWTPAVDFGAGPIAFSLDNAVRLFMDPTKGAYFGQLVDYLNAERAFMKGGAKP